LTWIKICAMTNVTDARVAADAGADAVGLIFAASPRRVTPGQARKIVAALPATMEKVGVFVNESADHIAEVVAEAGLTAVQLHGDEPAEFIGDLRHTVKSTRLRIIKTIGIAPGMEGAIRDLGKCQSLDAVLLDSVVVQAVAGADGVVVRGGTGVSFNWKRASAFVPGLARRTRVIVAGGLAPDTVAEAVHVLRPWGVDVCSGVEREPGKKDHAKVRAFIAAVRAAG
jgi:phosphoribosylanthranilate isomerase